MAGVSFPRIPTNSSLERVIIAFNAALEELDYSLGGFIDYKNISRIAQFEVGKDELKHTSGKVGLSGSDPNNDEAIRIWAGDDIDGQPNFKVTQAGILTAVAAIFMSALGYPKIELNADSDHLFKASSDADHNIYINPDYVDGAPAIIFHNPGGDTQMFETPDDTGDFMITTSSGKISIVSSTNDIELKCATGYKISVNSWNEFLNRFTGVTLQQEINSLQSQINSLNARVTALGG